ncbi:MAG: transcription antitermination factor NusB [Bacteriovoracaceae bacterium]|nr:transcription antitermination factor NusB [Bacteriovoracaceae bacterium]
MSETAHDSRTLARELAFQFLYQKQFREEGSQLSPIDNFNNFITSLGTELSAINREFALELITGSLENIQAIEETISVNCKDWKLGRLASIDRTILLLAIFELQYYKKNPPKVILNEAVNLAKKFGNESSASFINGLLDRLLEKISPL